MARQTTIVIGAGILGCALARGLASAGDAVLVIDAGRIGQAASGRSFGWINASFHADAHHFRLRQSGIDAWRRLEAERGALPIAWGGALCWEEQGAALRGMQETLTGLGYEADWLTGEALAQEVPHLGGLPDEALLFPREGVADSGAVTRALAEDAARLGARFMTGVTVEGILESGGRISGVRTAQGVLQSDRVVLAAGVGSAALAREAGVALPMLSRPGLLLTTLPVARVLDRVLVTPEGEIRQLRDGRIMMPTSVGHQGDTAEAITDSPVEIAQAALDRIRSYFPSEDLVLEEVTLAQRPVPQGGLPVVGPAGPEGLYMCVMHSGVTLAAIASELAVQEMVAGERAAILAPYGPERFQI